jgi:hypothetical protein
LQLFAGQTAAWVDAVEKERFLLGVSILDDYSALFFSESFPVNVGFNTTGRKI